MRRMILGSHDTTLNRFPGTCFLSLACLLATTLRTHGAQNHLSVQSQPPPSASAQDNALPAAAPSSALLGNADPMSDFSGQQLTTRGGFVNLSLFQDILDRDELLSALDALPASESVRLALLEALRFGYPTFVTQLDELRATKGDRFLDACEELGAAHAANGGSYQAEALYSRGNQLRSELRSAMRDVELRFLETAAARFDSNALEALRSSDLTTPDGSTLLQPLLLRARARYCTERVEAVRWADLELRRLLERANLSFAERILLDPILLQHEAFVAERSPERWRLSWARSQRIAALQEVQSNGVSKTSEAAEDHVHAAPVLVAREIRTSARQAVDSVLAVLEEPSRTTVATLIVESIYPEVYPDSTSPLLMLDKISARLRSREGELARAQAVIELWRPMYAALAARIELSIIQCSDDAAMLKGGCESVEQVRSMVRELLDERELLNATSSAMLEAIASR